MNGCVFFLLKFFTFIKIKGFKSLLFPFKKRPKLLFPFNLTNSCRIIIHLYMGLFKSHVDKMRWIGYHISEIILSLTLMILGVRALKRILLSIKLDGHY